MRWLISALLVAAMIAFGIGVYHGAEHFKGVHSTVRKPTEVSVQALPGTLYVVQQGAIYRFQHGDFKQITSENGWLQPSIDPRGNQLVAVQRHPNYSDLYLISTSGQSTGQTTGQLTHNASDTALDSNHWSFYPHFAPDGSALFYDFDPKDPYNGYRVDLAIYASPLNTSNGRALEWTYPNYYTGGDVNPMPLRGGGLLYVRYSIDEQFQVHSQIWLQKRAATDGVGLTDAAVDCGQAALSTDQTRVVMVCRKGSNTTAELDVATFDAASGTLGPLTTLATGGLVASPTFSPDGRSIAYFAPGTPGGQFQLWTVSSQGQGAPREITFDLGLDAQSPPVWVG
jgi:hypothetical protein